MCGVRGGWFQHDPYDLFVVDSSYDRNNRSVIFLITMVRRSSLQGPERHHWTTWVGTAIPLVTLPSVKSLFIASVMVLGACTAAPSHDPVPSPPAPVTTTSTGLVPETTMPIMGTARYGVSELDAWFVMKTDGRIPPSGSCIGSVDELARIFLEEGAAEGVRGDIAFIQAMVETGWLRHSLRVPASFCNYSGIGAVDGGSGANRFATAREGVRAQIQHLRAYADPTTTCSNFRHVNVDPRCKWVLPKGKSPNWNQMGKGNWATDPDYSSKILRLAGSLQKFVGR